MASFFGLADTLASTADCGHHGENQNAGRSCVLLSEEGGKRWQIVYMSQVKPLRVFSSSFQGIAQASLALLLLRSSVPLDDGPRSTGSGIGLLVFGVGGG